MTKPKIGDIWRYPYLWKREADAGEEGGRKPRPTALSAVVPVSEKSTLLYLLPITGTEPTKDQDALEIPATEIRRAGLSEYICGNAPSLSTPYADIWLSTACCCPLPEQVLHAWWLPSVPS